MLLRTCSELFLLVILRTMSSKSELYRHQCVVLCSVFFPLPSAQGRGLQESFAGNFSKPQTSNGDNVTRMTFKDEEGIVRFDDTDKISNNSKRTESSASIESRIGVQCLHRENAHTSNKNCSQISKGESNQNENGEKDNHQNKENSTITNLELGRSLNRSWDNTTVHNNSIATVVFELKNQSTSSGSESKDDEAMKQETRADDAPRHKSLLYQAIRESASTFGSVAVLRSQRSCKNQCGVSHHCSCKPICKMLQTCCIDFEEACSHVYDMTQFRFNQRIPVVDKECLNNLVVVASCPSGIPLRRYVEDTHNRVANQDLSSLRENHTEDTRNGMANQDVSNLRENHMGDKTSMNDVIKRNNSMSTFLSVFYLSQNKDGGNGSSYLDLGDAGNMLMALPLLDTSTGVSYKNVSTYVCNGASISHATPWDVFVPVDHYDALIWSDTMTVKDVFSLINVTNARFPYGYVNSRNELLEGNVEQCRPDAMASCPDNFTDEDVIEACRDTNFFIKAFMESDAEVKVLYKNPFCLYCNIEIHGNLVPGKNSYFTRIVNDKRSGLELTFNPLTHPQSHFRIVNRLKRQVEMPSWQTMSCNVSIPLHDRDVMQETSSKTGTITHERNERVLFGTNSTSDYAIVKSECVIDTCLYKYRPGLGRCAQSWYFILVLPPARYPLSHDYLTCVLGAWKAVLLNSTCADVWIEPPGEELVRQFGPVQELGGLQYGYSLHFQLKSGIYGFDNSNGFWTDDQKNSLVALLQDVSYPFQAGKNYFCVANKFNVADKDNYHRCRHYQKYNVMPVPLPTNYVANANATTTRNTSSFCHSSVPSLKAKHAPLLALVFLLSSTLVFFEETKELISFP